MCLFKNIESLRVPIAGVFRKIIGGYWQAVLLLLPMVCSAQPLVPPPAPPLLQYSYSFEHLSQEQGLSYNTVTSFTQDKQGFLWIGTFDGLNRYDGVNFKIFRPRTNDSTPQSSTQIRRLYTDKRGDIWIVNFDNTLQRFNPRTERFVNVPIADVTPLRGNFINAIMEDAEGILWITTSEDIRRYNAATQTFTSFFSFGSAKDTLNSLAGLTEFSDARAAASERRLWIRKRGGLVEFDPMRGKFAHYNFINTAEDQHFFYSEIVRDSAGFLWLSHESDIYCFDMHSKKLVAHYPEERYASQSLFINPKKNYFPIRTTLCAPDGTVWFGSYGGIVTLRHNGNPQKATLTLHQNDDANPMSLSGNGIRTLFTDKSGVVWVGGEPFGINKYTPYKQKFLLYQHSATNSNTLGNNYVRGICQDRNGVLWIATHFNGISRYDPANGQWTRFHENIQKNTSKKHALPVNEIWAVYEDRSGALWAGTRGNGLLRFDARAGQFVQSLLVPKTSIVQVITEDRAGNLLVGTRGNTPNTGVYEIAPASTANSRQRSVRFYNTAASSSVVGANGDVQAIYESPDGILWVGGEKNLFRINRTHNDIADYTHKLLAGYENSAALSIGCVASSILEDRDGTMWITTKVAGVRRYDRERDIFTPFTEHDGLPNNNVYAMIQDTKGNFWISSDAGLSLWDRRANTFRTFTIADGLQGREYNRRSFFKSTNGMMFFGGTNGLNAFHPDSLRFNPLPPPIALTQLKIFAQEMPLDSIITRPPSELRDYSGTVTLRHDQNFLSFAFAALDFHVPQNNVYAYTLEGVDKDWIQNGTKREAAYTNLDAGEYMLRIRAANNDGVWNMDGLTLRVVILPPWWATWWFRTLMVVVACGVVVGVLQSYRRRIARLQQHQEELLLHIEERQRAEAELQVSEQKFRALFETSPLGMMLWAADGRMLEVNAAFGRISGYTTDEAVTINFWTLLNESQNTVIRYSLKQRGSFGPVEQSLVRASGEKLSVILYGIAIGGATGIGEHPRDVGDGRVWSVLEDVTERKRATDAMLRYQLNPHFMFNVLNSVNSLMSENQRNARRMIIQFSSLLRHTLMASSKQTAPLGDEIEAVEHYLAIEKLRFEERLEATIDAERRTLGLNVPVFLVQPLVENAIKYGMQSSEEALTITITSSIQGEQPDEWLCIEVCNTGEWLREGLTDGVSTDAPSTAKRRSTGIGLENLRKRLQQLYPDGHSMSIQAESGVVTVAVRIATRELTTKS